MKIFEKYVWDCITLHNLRSDAEILRLFKVVFIFYDVICHDIISHDVMLSSHLSYPSIHTHTRGVNTDAHVSSCTCINFVNYVHIYTYRCACLCTGVHEIFFVVHYCFLSLNIKFFKDCTFGCRDISTIILIYINH